MNRVRSILAALLVAASVAHAGAQVPAEAPPTQVPRDAPAPPTVPPAPQAPPIPEIAAPPAEPAAPPFDFGRARRSVFRIGQDLTIPQDDAAREATVIFGDARVDGRVDQVVVVLGSLRLGPAASVGNVVVVGGNTTAEAGADIRGDFVAVGGAVEAPPGFSPGGAHVVFGSGIVGDWLNSLAPYLTRGLLWGRLIVPGLAWIWGVVAFLFLLYLLISVLFERPVRACAATLAARPLTAFGTGLLVLLLVGPVSLLLAASVIGIAVVPFVLCAVIAGAIVGRVAVARWMGMSILPEDEDSRAHAARSFVIGFALITIAYMIPVIGIVTWGIVGVFGLGSATLAFFSAYRRERPRPAVTAPPAVGDAPPPPVPAPYTPPAAAPVQFAAADHPRAAELPPLGAPEPAAATTGAAAAASAAAAIPLAAPSLLVTMPRALFRDRLAAFVLDVVLVGVTLIALSSDLDDAFLPFLLVYHVGFWTWKQTTVGGLVTQIRLVRTDGAPLGFPDALIRGLASILSLAVFFIGALWMLRDPESQTWHDKVAGTYVVKVPKNWPL